MDDVNFVNPTGRGYTPSQVVDKNPLLSPQMLVNARPKKLPKGTFDVSTSEREVTYIGLAPRPWVNIGDHFRK